jgi:hypothetical protein
LKEASPIAASLYKLIPEKLKQYPLYRTITGEAIKMLKEGMEADVIAETLEKKYIDPLLDTPKKNCENRTDKKHIITDLVSSMRHFTSYPPSGEKRITRRQRSLLLQKIAEGQSVSEYFPSTNAGSSLQHSRNISVSACNEPQPSEPPKRRTKTTHGLIYLGRLPECKELKIWVRPINS